MDPYISKYENIVNLIINAGKSSGYQILRADHEFSYTFDLILKREKIIVAKVIYNVSLLNEDEALALNSFSSNIEAYPIIVGVINRKEKIEDGVLYSRYSIPVVSPRTFINFLKYDEEPMVRAGPGGFYVDIDVEKFRRIREERNISLGELASITNTSRRTILLYENGMSMSLDIALKLEEFLGTELIESTSLLSKNEACDFKPIYKKMKEFERFVNYLLESKGFEVYPYRKSMVNMIIREEVSLFLGGIQTEMENLRKKVEFISEISNIVNKDGILIVKEANVEVKNKVPIITVEDLEKLNDKRDIKYLIQERKEV